MYCIEFIEIHGGVCPRKVAKKLKIVRTASMLAIAICSIKILIHFAVSCIIRLIVGIFQMETVLLVAMNRRAERGRCALLQSGVCLAALLMVLSFGTVHGAGPGQVTTNEIPYSETFESFTPDTTLPGSNGWSAAAFEKVVISTSATIIDKLNNGYSGALPSVGSHAKVVYIENSPTNAVTNTIVSTTERFVETDFMAMPYRMVVPIVVDSAAQAGLCIDSNGQLNVLHASTTNGVTFTNEWHVLSAVPEIPEQEWMRLTILQDYSNGVFQVRFNGGSPVVDSKGWTGAGGARPGSWFYMVSRTNSHMSGLEVTGTAYIDDLRVVEVTGPPDEATVPLPSETGLGLALDCHLLWEAIAGADSYNVYFGTSATLDSSDFQGNQTGTIFDPGALDPGTTYYWRVDEVNADGSRAGVVWSFTTASAPVGAGSGKLSFVEDFEFLSASDVHNQNAWQTTLAGAGMVQSSGAQEGDQACVLTDAVLSRTFSDPSATNIVWADFQTKPAFGIAWPQTNSSAAFYIDTNGYPVVYDGTNAAVLSAPQLDSNAWVRFTVRLSYSDQTWDLYCNGSHVATNCGFYATSQNTFGEISVSGAEEETWLDGMSISYVSPFTNWGTLVEADALPTNTLLPFVDSFEQLGVTRIHNINRWSTDHTDSYAWAKAGDGFAGSKGIKLSYAEAWHGVTNTTATNAWIDLCLKPIRHEIATPPPLGSNTTAAFYINASGYIVARSNDTWVTLSSGSPIPTGVWQRVTMNLDYQTDTWSLYLVGDTPNMFSERIGHALGFATNTVDQVRGLRITQRNSASYFDNVAIGTLPPYCIDADGDGLADGWEREHIGSMTNLPGGDSDGDGLSNRDEYVLGTDPDDVASCQLTMSVDLANETSSDITVTCAIDNPSPYALGGDRSGRRFTIRTAEDAVAAKTAAGSVTQDLASAYSTPEAWTDTNAASLYATRYYDVVVSLADNVATNTQQWGMLSQPRLDEASYAVSVPFDYGDENRLDSTLGRHLMRGLHAGSVATNSDQIEFLGADSQWKVYSLIDNNGTNEWWDYLVAKATNAIAPGEGFRIIRRNGSRSRTNCVIVAPTHTATVAAVSFPTNNAADGWRWRLFGWPYAEAVACTGQVSPFGFADLGYGGSRSTGNDHTKLGDQIWVWDAEAQGWRYYWLVDDGVGPGPDGKWWDSQSRSLAQFSLDPGAGYYYRHHVTTNGPPTGTNFSWQPLLP